MRPPVMMAMIFNGAGLLATVTSFLERGPILLPLVVLVATVIVTPGAVIALSRFGLAESQAGLGTAGMPEAGPGASVA